MSNPPFASPPIPAPPAPGPSWGVGKVLIIAIGAVILALIIGVKIWRIGRVVSNVKSALSESEKSQRRVELKNQLKALGVQFALYESKNKKYPADEASFLKWLSEVPDPGLARLKCHNCDEKITLLMNVAPAGTWKSQYGHSYSWAATGITDAAPPDLPIAWHLCAEQEELLILYFQGRVDSYRKDSPGAKTVEAIRATK